MLVGPFIAVPSELRQVSFCKLLLTWALSRGMLICHSGHNSTLDDIRYGLEKNGGAYDTRPCFNPYIDMIYTDMTRRENKAMRGIQKETSRKPRNRPQYLYVRSIGPGCEALVPLRHKALNGSLVKFLGLRSAHTAWRSRPR